MFTVSWLQLEHKECLAVPDRHIGLPVAADTEVMVKSPARYLPSNLWEGLTLEVAPVGAGGSTPVFRLLHSALALWSNECRSAGTLPSL